MRWGIHYTYTRSLAVQGTLFVDTVRQAVYSSENLRPYIDKQIHVDRDRITKNNGYLATPSCIVEHKLSERGCILL